ncbi:MAG: ecdysteroid 22-kinase family protein [Desulfuromonadales bacterium]|nr:ecdysteroid 22-kinase family protein [Desulfuromonadales bacterium]
MHKDFSAIIKQATGASDIDLIEVIQELWSGYGTIRRYRLSGADRERVVVKHVHVAEQGDHPRGWNTNWSHLRKLRSYEVESAWYANWSDRCDEGCRIPQCLALETRGEETLMVLEDLDEAGFSVRRQSVGEQEILACLRWLANFHATFIGCKPEGLWGQGTYWHLDTRPDELEALADLPLKQAAKAIDRLLRESCYQTFVHGDAKLANFCFSENGEQVAAVDFQYVGGGCGMKDIAYFIGSCLAEGECQRQEAWLLDSYFTALKQALARRQPSVDAKAVEKEWRTLFPLAWTDFHRFLKGWSPGHWKLNAYSERVAHDVIESFGG